MRPPLVTVVLTTRDRPRFLPLALELYRRQTYANRELVVVDDGEQPVPTELVEQVGGRLLRLAEPTVLGTKLNLGVEAGNGRLCVKMDDDDWYAPAYVETMVQAIVARQVTLCQPTIAFLTAFRFFDLAGWRLRRADDGSVPGATLVFAREDWAERPFRAVTNNEDLWFVRDLLRLGATPLPLPARETYLAVRHGGAAGERGHVWRQQWNGETLDTYLEEHRPLERTPEEVLPDWALAAYRDLRPVPGPHPLVSG